MNFASRNSLLKNKLKGEKKRRNFQEEKSDECSAVEKENSVLRDNDKHLTVNSDLERVSNNFTESSPKLKSPSIEKQYINEESCEPQLSPEKRTKGRLKERNIQEDTVVQDIHSNIHEKLELKSGKLTKKKTKKVIQEEQIEKYIIDDLKNFKSKRFSEEDSKEVHSEIVSIDNDMCSPKKKEKSEEKVRKRREKKHKLNKSDEDILQNDIGQYREELNYNDKSKSKRKNKERTKGSMSYLMKIKSDILSSRMESLFPSESHIPGNLDKIKSNQDEVVHDEYKCNDHEDSISRTHNDVSDVQSNSASFILNNSRMKENIAQSSIGDHPEHELNYSAQICERKEKCSSTAMKKQSHNNNCMDENHSGNQERIKLIIETDEIRQTKKKRSKVKDCDIESNIEIIKQYEKSCISMNEEKIKKKKGHTKKTNIEVMDHKIESTVETRKDEVFKRTNMNESEFHVPNMSQQIKTSKEIFIEHNFLPTTEIDLSDCDEDLELDSESEKFLSLRREPLNNTNRCKKYNSIKTKNKVVESKIKNSESVINEEKKDILSRIFPEAKVRNGKTSPCSEIEIEETEFHDGQKEVWSSDHESNEVFSFYDILSQRHENKLQKKFNQIISETPKNNSTRISINKQPSPRSKNDRVSVVESSDITGDRKSDSWCNTYSTQSTRDENVREKKKKVYEMLKESKSIDDIEEELNLPTFIAREKESVKDLVIETPFSIPLLHRIAYYTNNAPSKQQREKLEESGLKPKLGNFSKMEDRQIKSNWLQFCEHHKWDENNYHPFLKGTSKSKNGVLTQPQLLKFVHFISQGFENRYMYTVYNRFQRIFSQIDRDSCTKFTPEDDRIILKYVKKSGSTEPFADIADILNRSRNSVLKRCQFLRERRKMNDSKIVWDKKLTEELIANLVETTCSINLTELKDRPITSQEWRAVSTRMNIPVMKLKRAWNQTLHLRLFDRRYVKKVQEVKPKLLDHLFMKYKDWREVKWVDVATELDTDLAPNKLYSIFKNMTSTKVPKRFRSNLHKSLEYMKEHSKYIEFKSLNTKKFVRDILKETQNGKIIPKIERLDKEVIDEDDDDNLSCTSTSSSDF